MDNFREWLSDNLRYIMLGAAILILLALIGFTTHWLTTRSSDDKKEEQKEEQMDQQAEEDEAQIEEVDEEIQETPEPSKEPEEDQKAKENAKLKSYEAVDNLVQTYYSALGNRDIEGLKQLVDQLDPAEANSIVNSPYIEGYSNVKVLIKDGFTKESFVVFAEYDHKYVGYDTLLPGVSCLYVNTGEDGNPYVVAEPTPEQQDWIQQVMEAQDVQMFLASKQKEYETILETDPQLKDFLSELGVQGSSAMEAEEGAVITVRSECDVRKEAAEESEKVGELAGGQQVTKIGQDGEWIKISTEGMEGYVRSDSFQ